MKTMSNVERPIGRQVREMIDQFIQKRWTILTACLFLIGSFFLSQSVLFDSAVPFFLPIWALAFVRFPKQMVFVFIGGMIGSALLGVGQALIHLLQLLLFQFSIKHSFARKSIPLTVAVSIIVVQVVWQFVMYAGNPPLSIQIAIGFEALLALVMTLFLFIAFPYTERLLFGQWTPERLGAVCVVGMMMVTGMGGFVIGPISIATSLLHLTILLAAVAGGLPFATTIAMLIGAISGLSELSFTGMMAVYGLTGFAAGAVKRLGKIGIATSAFAVSVFFLLYDVTLPLDITHFLSILVATVVFFFIPSKKIEPIQKIIKPIPEDLSKKQQKWLMDRMNEQLSDFQQFAQFMSTLVTDRDQMESMEGKEKVIPTICQSCFRYSKCWEGVDDGEEMDQLLLEWESTYSMTKKAARQRVEKKIQYKCIRFSGLMDELEEQSSHRLLHGQLQHGRKMIALQLRDMSKHLEKILTGIQEDLTTYQHSEEELARRFQAQHIEYYQIDVLSEERGAYRVVCSLPEKRSDFETDTTFAEMLILPILEEMYDEPFQVESSVRETSPFAHIQVTFCSAVRFQLDYGVVAVAGSGSFHPGDAYEIFSIHEGLTAILLSDGMGQDMKAYRESRKVIRLMKECLDRKMDPETAMHTLHYMMSLNGLDDMYATLDLALIDLQEGQLWSWKAGSMSTYIKRGHEFIRLESQAVPVGFLPSSSVEAKQEMLKSGDLIVMLTDGMFNGEISLEKQEQAIHRMLDKYGDLPSESIANQILSEMERKFGAVLDDRTVLVIRVDHILPTWQTIKLTNRDISRERVVG